ncbi:hypothetical protein TVAGG3_0336280 [Trichomonas vaginalis G3]|nr:hypothetical protein TVAGG3_0336280 [Trichomonas vaginalis G3]KAI5530294.1 hypothetical protein TVAGG3_0336280 [Trichomonas vaginalis G3]
MKDHYKTNGMIHRSKIELPMKILGVTSNKTETTEIVKDLQSLQEIVKAKYPLLVNETLSEECEKVKYKVDKTEGCYHVTFEKIKVSKEGKELKGVFYKGFVEVKYGAYTRNIEEEQISYRKSRRKVDNVPRPLTKPEVDIIFDIVREKISH